MLFQQLNASAVHALDGFIQLKLLPKVLGPCGGITQCRHVHPLNSSRICCQLSSLRSLKYFLRGRNHSKELSAGLAPSVSKTANFLNAHAFCQCFCTLCFILCLQVASCWVQATTYMCFVPADLKMAKALGLSVLPHLCEHPVSNEVLKW